ncbi:NADH dehydrogenase 1 alpha subcomplex subunit 2-like protein [Gaertneriomyces semiglobifer]|nr:NADH dehydrogenase 1 alpha subcomplex subunit 2-like protein [Gaertneriomyces semiglobifer]
MSWRSTLSKNLKEIRIHLDQKSQGSKGLRDFVLKEYPKIKEANPTLPVLIREAAGVKARVYGRYAFGQERSIQLENLSESEIENRVKQLANPQS